MLDNNIYMWYDSNIKGGIEHQKTIYNFYWYWNFKWFQKNLWKLQSENECGTGNFYATIFRTTIQGWNRKEWYQIKKWGIK